MTEDSPPWRYRVVTWFWVGVTLMLLAAFIVKKSPVDASKTSYYHKAKESRRGDLRKAKEGVGSVQVQQQRHGVVRSVWIQDPDGPRRQFFLEAEDAEVGTSVDTKETSLKEKFSQARGCLQEELFWEVSSTSEHVIKRGNTWVKATPPHRPISERLYPEVIPAQRVRFFDAETAEWDPVTNSLVTHSSFFCIVKARGHELPAKPEDGQILTKGVARSMTFLFDKKGHQHVTCQGVHLQCQDKPQQKDAQ